MHTVQVCPMGINVANCILRAAYDIPPPSVLDNSARDIQPVHTPWVYIIHTEEYMWTQCPQLTGVMNYITLI